MALLETKEKTANCLGFSWFILNPGIATKQIPIGSNYAEIVIFPNKKHVFERTVGSRWEWLGV